MYSVYCTVGLQFKLVPFKNIEIYSLNKFGPYILTINYKNLVLGIFSSACADCWTLVVLNPFRSLVPALVCLSKLPFQNYLADPTLFLIQSNTCRVRYCQATYGLYTTTYVDISSNV